MRREGPRINSSIVQAPNKRSRFKECLRNYSSDSPKVNCLVAYTLEAACGILRGMLDTELSPV